ncbi:MAG TPA: helix-turn-helix transcriptional regulator [Hanamia sp.]
MNKTIHHGRNIKRFREMLGFKQEGLAIELGDDWNQQKISLLEQKEVVDDALLSQVAEVLKVPAEAIKNFDEEAAIYNIQNNYEGSNVGNNSGSQNFNCTFNPLEKYMEAIEENKKLYERLLRAEREKNDLLQSMLKK